MKDTEDLKLSLETYQDINDNQIKDLETSIKNMKENHKQEMKQLNDIHDHTKNKLNDFFSIVSIFRNLCFKVYQCAFW